MKNTILLLFCFIFSTSTVFADSCKVKRTTVFSKAMTSPPGPNNGDDAVLGAALQLKNDVIVVPVGVATIPAGGPDTPGYLFVDAKGKSSHFTALKIPAGLEPKEPGGEMTDYRPIQLSDGRVVVGSQSGTVYYMDSTGAIVQEQKVWWDPKDPPGVYVVTQYKDGSLLVVSKGEDATDLVSPDGKKTDVEGPYGDLSIGTYATAQELSDGHILIGGQYAASGMGLQIWNRDGSAYVMIPSSEFTVNQSMSFRTQEATEFSNGVVAVPGFRLVPGNPNRQNTIAFIDLVTKETTFSDFGPASATFIQKMKSSDDYLVGFFRDKSTETLRYMHGTEKLWEHDVPALAQSLAVRDIYHFSGVLSDSTIVSLAAPKVQFYSQTGDLKGEFDFSSDIDSGTHKLETPENVMVLSDDTVVVEQYFWEGVRLSYLKLKCK